MLRLDKYTLNVGVVNITHIMKMGAKNIGRNAK